MEMGFRRTGFMENKWRTGSLACHGSKLKPFARITLAFYFELFLFNNNCQTFQAATAQDAKIMENKFKDQDTQPNNPTEANCSETPSADICRKAVLPNSSLVTFFRDSPLVDSGIVLTRDKSTGRNIEL